MKRILILCLTFALLCVGCTDDSHSKKDSGIETSNAADESDRNSETETVVTTNTAETSGEEKEFIVTEPNEENITTAVSRMPVLKPDQTKTETAVSPVSTTKTPAKTYIAATAQADEKTTAETKSEVIELPFVPIG